MNIDEMKAGRELDALIAEKVMGIEIMNGIPCKHPGCLSHVSHPCEGCGRWHPSLVPHYSTDIAAAWKVVENLSNEYYVDIGVDNGGAQVQLDRLDNEWELNIESTFADTTPLAICRAALKAIKNT